MEHKDELKAKVANGPTDFPDKAGKHTPELKIEGGKATVTVPHGMADDHWIEFIWAKSGDEVIAAVKLAPTDTPTLIFDVPSGVTAITAYESCNLHGVWASEPVTV